ncbi:hypothetical protein DXG01_005543 [Tephrocybe rancida]|nr:hypothetical protein DXG01_005543 [Tephrocybe rancida]
MPRQTFRPRNIPCSVTGCERFFTNRAGVSNHIRTSHANVPQFPDPEGGELEDFCHPDPVDHPSREQIRFHPVLNGRPCDAHGEYLPDGAPPPLPKEKATDNFFPYMDRNAFELADLLYRRDQMANPKINDLLQIWAATLRGADREPPFDSANDLHSTIDATLLGDVPWQSFSITYNGDVGEDAPSWQTKSFHVHFRDPRVILHNQVGNSDFAGEIDVAPKQVTDNDGKRRFQDFMSGNYPWRQCDTLAQEDPNNAGATFCPIILGSDKTTVSVGTGHTEYYPLYISNGLIHNNVRRAHRNGVTLLAFLAIPKTDREHHDSEEFRKFRRQLFHGSIREILQSVLPYMTTPDIVRFADGHFRRTLYGLGPYIADYPEQVLTSCVVQGWCAKCNALHNNLDGEGGRRSHDLTLALMDAMGSQVLWDEYGIVDGIMPFTHYFPRADIHELLAPDLLHQLIKGVFKDHLVTWVNEYLELTYGSAGAARIMADIDRRIAAAPPFPNLRRFPEGRGFKQWTGDDSKALMKVYLPAIVGYVPPQMVRTIAAFMEFCYLVRRSVIDEDDLVAIDDALATFHRERVIFEHEGVRPDGFSLPRQHSMVHYRHLIQEFGAPNGLCSSITESKHIKAVKEPWRRSNRYEALGQMLITNQRLDKLAAARVDFKARGMLDGSLFLHLPPPLPIQIAPNNNDDDDDGGAVDDDILGEVTLARKAVPKLPRNIYMLAQTLSIPRFPELVSRFLYEQHQRHLGLPFDDVDEVPLDECPIYVGKVLLYPSAVATFYAPSDKSGTYGMYHERIRAVQSWRKGPRRQDCVFVEHDSGLPGFRGLHAARVLHFLSLRHNGIHYPCALVTWFSVVGDEPCSDTGMWIVRPDIIRSQPVMSIIHLDTILRGAHLMGIAGKDRVPLHFRHTDTLDGFKFFYVNKYIDYHAHEIAY